MSTSARAGEGSGQLLIRDERLLFIAATVDGPTSATRAKPKPVHDGDRDRGMSPHKGLVYGADHGSTTTTVRVPARTGTSTSAIVAPLALARTCTCTMPSGTLPKIANPSSPVSVAVSLKTSCPSE